MKQIGVVEAVNGNEITVRVNRESACGGNCASCSAGCQSGKITVTAENRAGAVTGDKVIIEMPSQKILGAAALVYILPILFLILGDIIFDMIFHNETAALLGGMALMAAVYICIIMQNKKNKNKYRLVVEKKL